MSFAYVTAKINSSSLAAPKWATNFLKSLL